MPVIGHTPGGAPIFLDPARKGVMPNSRKKDPIGSLKEPGDHADDTTGRRRPGLSSEQQECISAASQALEEAEKEGLNFTPFGGP